ncbi:hypothetical protein AGIG_G9313 [Arapaima gigas]
MTPFKEPCYPPPPHKSQPNAEGKTSGRPSGRGPHTLILLSNRERQLRNVADRTLTTPSHPTLHLPSARHAFVYRLSQHTVKCTISQLANS